MIGLIQGMIRMEGEDSRETTGFGVGGCNTGALATLWTRVPGARQNANGIYRALMRMIFSRVVRTNMEKVMDMLFGKGSKWQMHFRSMPKKCHAHRVFDKMLKQFRHFC